jgi:Tfp pilus assembly protein PilO
MKLSPKARQGAVILLAAASVLLFFATLPFFWQASLREQSAALQAEINLLNSKLAARSGAARSALTEAAPLDSMFLPGSTAGTTLAAFQEFVGEAAAISGLSVLRMQPLAAEEKAGLAAYRLSVEATGSLEQLRAFFVDVETMLPMVIVTGFELQPQSEGGEDMGSDPSESLAVSLRLEAYAWKVAP